MGYSAVKFYADDAPVMTNPETGEPSGLVQLVDDMEGFFDGEDVCYECGRPLESCLDGKCP